MKKKKIEWEGKLWINVGSKRILSFFQQQQEKTASKSS